MEDDSRVELIARYQLMRQGSDREAWGCPNPNVVIQRYKLLCGNGDATVLNAQHNDIVGSASREGN